MILHLSLCTEHFEMLSSRCNLCLWLSFLLEFHQQLLKIVNSDLPVGL